MTESKVALALGGGGAKGAFQVGAAQYLYREKGLRPQIICGTSVGALNGAKLAEGEGALEALTQIWLEQMKSNQSMYLTQDWYANLSGLIDALALNEEYGEINWAKASIYIRGTTQAVSKAKTALSIYDLSPIGTLLQTHLDPGKVANSGIALRLTGVALESGKLRYVTETGALLERNGEYVRRYGSLPAGTSELAKQVEAQENEVARAQARLQRAAPNEKPELREEIRELSSVLLQLKAQLAAAIKNSPPPTEPAIVDLRQAVMASAAVPVAFAPVELAGEHYVDGGVRELVPIQAALDLGATEVYVIGLDKPVPNTALWYKMNTLLGVAQRCIQTIMLDELQRDDLAPSAPGVTIHKIMPTLLVNDALTIDPDLIRTNMAYGYMRAADALLDPALQETAMQLSDKIINARILHLSMMKRGEQIPDSIRSGIQSLLESRQALGAAIPPEAWSWGTPAPAPTPEPLPDPIPAQITWDAAVIESTLSGAFTAGEGMEVTITMRNTGNQVWRKSEGCKLARTVSASSPVLGPAYFYLPVEDVQPGEAASFFFTLNTRMAGTYRCQYQMMQGNGTLFGTPTESVSVVVMPAYDEAGSFVG